MSDPFPLPSHNDGAHTVLVTLGKKMLVGDVLGPDPSKALGAEGEQFVEVTFSHPPAF